MPARTGGMAGRYRLFVAAMPVTFIAAVTKTLVHFLLSEPMPESMNPFFPSMLTGIIFLLGFFVAGLMSDYKESEKIPNDIVTSLFIIWQEAEVARAKNGSPEAASLIGKIKAFTPVFKEDFLGSRGQKAFELIESFSREFAAMDAFVPAPFMTRLRAEQANLKKLLSRINVIRDTEFIPGVFIIIKMIGFSFLGLSLFLNVNPWWIGVILVSFFTFIFFSIIIFISDIEDPFNYYGDYGRADKVSLSVLDSFAERLEAAND